MTNHPKTWGLKKCFCLSYNFCGSGIWGGLVQGLLSQKSDGGRAVIGGEHPSPWGLRTGGLAWASLQHGNLEAVGLFTWQLRTSVQVFRWASKTEAPPPFITQPEKSQGLFCLIHKPVQIQQEGTRTPFSMGGESSPYCRKSIEGGRSCSPLWRFNLSH